MAEPDIILFLAANPSDTARLAIDREAREIDDRLLGTREQYRWRVEKRLAVRVRDLQTCLLRYQPRIVHFSGHGSAEGELLLEDETGAPTPVAATALAELFQKFRDDVQCVVLNACFSAIQAEAVVQHIDCVIGMTTALGDEAAIAFAGAFYQALGFGKDVQTAFELGCNEIHLEQRDKDHVPRLLMRPKERPPDAEPPADPVQALQQRSRKWSIGIREPADPWRDIRYLQAEHARLARDEAALMYEAARRMHAERMRLVRRWGLAALGIALAAALVVSAIGHAWLAGEFGSAPAVIILLLVTVIFVLIGRELKQYCLDDEVRGRDAWNDNVNKLAQRLGEPRPAPEGA